MITKLQKDVFIFIKDFLHDNKYAPSYQEIGEGCGIKHISHVKKRVDSLERQGYINKVKNLSRTITINYDS